MKNILALLIFLIAAPFSVIAQHESDERGPETEIIIGDEIFQKESDEESNEGSESKSSLTTHVLVRPSEVQGTQQYSKQPIKSRSFDDAAWRKIVEDEDYFEKPPEPVNFDFMPDAFAIDGIWLQAIAYTVIGTILLIIVFYVAQNFTRSKRASDSMLQRMASDQIDDIQALDISAMLNDALQKGNLKLAVRFYYLSLLKNLNNAGYIRWEKDKTNRDYLTELFRQGVHYDDVRVLTRKYEEVWYGDYDYTEAVMKETISRFEALNKELLPKLNRES